LPDADIIRTKQQLSDQGLVPEDWGGKTIMVEISAKQNLGVDDLLEMILLQAEIMELKADSEGKATGVVIESHMQKGAGSMATVLIENGSLRQGEPIAIGSAFGKVRILEDFNGLSIKVAGPSTPVRIAGLRSLPDFGSRLLAFNTEKEARENAEKEEKTKPVVKIATARRIAGTEAETKQIEQKELKIIIKCDVAGSLEAVKKSLGEIQGEDYGTKIIAEGVGAISDSDITLAKATGSIVIGFRVNIVGAARRIAEKEGVRVETFQVIYEIIDFVKSEIASILPPEIIEDEVGTGKVLAIFRDDRKGFVAGGTILSGHLAVGNEIKFYQNKSEKYRAKVLSLRREKSEAREVEAGTDCGFGLPAMANVAVGDTFIVFKTVHKKRSVQ